MHAKSTRLLYLVLIIGTIALGLLARRLLPMLPAKYAGVALYAVMMVWVVKVVRPTLPRAMACAAALAMCFAIEALQATPLPARLCAEFPLLHYVLGEVFSWGD